jgi:hypothetical protein
VLLVDAAPGTAVTFAVIALENAFLTSRGSVLVAAGLVSKPVVAIKGC